MGLPLLCRATLLACALVSLALPAAAAAAPVQSVTVKASSSTVEYGTTVRFAGSMSPAAMDVPVQLEILAGTTWRPWTTVRTKAYGKFVFDARMTMTSAVRARITYQGATKVSPATRVAVVPFVRITSVATGLPFMGARVTARVAPASYAATVPVVVSQSGRVLARTTTYVGNGRMSVVVPTPGVGPFRAEITLPRRYAISERRLVAGVRSASHNLSVGSRGPIVRALNQRLRALGFLTRDLGTTYTSSTADAVLAFRKYYRQQRVGTVNDSIWQLLGRATRNKPRYSSPATHIEVDKTRQILMVVQNGVVTGTIHVSTGRTGNTPEGRFRIYQMGGSYLYRFMAFHGNFGIHGYKSVPARPASAGCVREPMWAADWVWNRSFMGETVYVYR